jgi:hypothetical protein
MNFSGSFDYDLDFEEFAPETIRSKQKVSLHSIFHLGSGIKKMFGSGKTSQIHRNTGRG